jgi:hypothetical protein
MLNNKIFSLVIIAIFTVGVVPFVSAADNVSFDQIIMHTPSIPFAESDEMLITGATITYIGSNGSTEKVDVDMNNLDTFIFFWYMHYKWLSGTFDNYDYLSIFNWQSTAHFKVPGIVKGKKAVSISFLVRCEWDGRGKDTYRTSEVAIPDNGDLGEFKPWHTWRACKRDNIGIKMNGVSILSV